MQPEGLRWKISQAHTRITDSNFHISLFDIHSFLLAVILCILVVILNQNVPLSDEKFVQLQNLLNIGSE